MDTLPLVIRYSIWSFILALCFYAFHAGSNSTPIEAFSIVLAGLLLMSAYLLQLTNKYFMLILWIGFILSTSAITWLILLYIARPYGTESTVFLYVTLITAVLWWRIKNSRIEP